MPRVPAIVRFDFGAGLETWVGGGPSGERTVEGVPVL
jgi:hypothetical protein